MNIKEILIIGAVGIGAYFLIKYFTANGGQYAGGAAAYTPVSIPSYAQEPQAYSGRMVRTSALKVISRATPLKEKMGIINAVRLPSGAQPKSRIYKFLTIQARLKAGKRW